MVYLVGAGPGDAGLITCRGLELLKRCDAVIYDRLGTLQLLEYVRPDCEKIYVGKQAGAHYKKQEQINQILVEAGKKYACVVRLKGGDPFVFGRGGEEIEELLAHKIPFQVVPGITSAIAVPELAGIPVTHRKVSRSVHIITGHTARGETEDVLEQVTDFPGTSVYLMGLGNLEKITGKLLKEGKRADTPVAVISNGTLPGQRMLQGRLDSIADKVREEKLPSPAIIVIGETASYKYICRYMGKLQGLCFGVTGTRCLREKISERLQELGARVYSLCDMQVEVTDQIERLREEAMHMEQYTWVAFTSQNTITLFFDYLKKWKIDLRCLAHVKFAVVGTGTKEALEKEGYQADYIPKQYTTKSLASGLAEILTGRDKLLLPRAKQGSVAMTDILEQSQVAFCEIPIYDVVGTRMENMEYFDQMNSMLFVSASGVRAFAAQTEKEKLIRLKEWVKKGEVQIAALGKVTREALEKAGLDVAIEPKQNDVEGLVQELVRFYEDRNNTIR